MSSIVMSYGMDKQVHEGRFPLHAICRLTAPGLFYASLLGLAGCATSGELESLRAEVAIANATALRAETEASRTQRELAELKAAAKPPEEPSRPRKPPALSSAKPAGYKWGPLPR
jgi:hypothetical protein